MLLIRTFLTADCNSKEYTMSRKQFSPSKQLMLATALAFGASGVALADDSSMSPFTGDSWAYFNGNQNLGQANQAGAPRAQALAATGNTNKSQPKVAPKNVLPNARVTTSPPSPFTDKGT
jgi:hypothetical protein